MLFSTFRHVLRLYFEEMLATHPPVWRITSSRLPATPYAVCIVVVVLCVLL